MGYLGGHSFYSLSAPYDTDDGIPLSFRFFSISFTGSEGKYASLPSFIISSWHGLFPALSGMRASIMFTAIISGVMAALLRLDLRTPPRRVCIAPPLFLRTSPAFPNTVGTSSFKISAPCISFLRASKEETMKRAIERSKLDRETNIELVETMWKQFSNLGIYELNVIDTTTHSIKDTVSAVQEKIASKRTTLVEESELTHVAAPDNPTKEFENRQERFALYRAMQQLDAETREVIHLRLAGDFSFRDIGDILGHSEVWARVRFYRGKEKLVKIIGGDNNA